MDIKRRIIIKKCKNNILTNIKSTIRTILKPVLIVEDKYIKHKEKIFDKKLQSLTIEEISKRTIDLIQEELIRYYNPKRDNSIEFTVAAYTVDDNYTHTVLEYISRQNKDKLIKTYSYRIYKEEEKLRINKELSNAIYNHFTNISNINTKWFKNNETKCYYIDSILYEATFSISLSKEVDN